MIAFYAPTPFEIPFGWHRQTRSFGMGQMSAENLTQKLETSPAKKFVIFGSAGALNPQIKVGECFLIQQISSLSSQFSIPSLPSLPRAKLYTSERILKSANEKKTLFEKTNSDLVDMEMFFIWKMLSENTRQRCIFVRGVFDTHNESLFGASKIVRSIPDWYLYQKNMAQFLTQLLKYL